MNKNEDEWFNEWMNEDVFDDWINEDDFDFDDLRKKFQY